jgi:hypothetical protein
MKQKIKEYKEKRTEEEIIASLQKLRLSSKENILAIRETLIQQKK